ncbi:MAG: hypothetical protein FJ403_20515 [Verrucomicrobia bacterium]|nr:hypothetical protein [Verrucomicrobiota bacterium]
MDSKLEELSHYIRQTLPQPKAITRLAVIEKAQAVSFAWHSREFIVKPTCEVLELKGNSLFITGASMLIQAAFTKKDKNEKVLVAVDETLQQVEDLASKHQTERALSLLEPVKQTLRRLIGPGASNGRPA